MQCDNCGYIFFQPSKKCACCSAPYSPAQSAFEVGQENLFTIFEMAPGEGGIPGGMGMAGAGSGVEDYNFTDDFDTGGAEYGVDENVLDLSDAEAEGFGPSTVDASGPMSVDDFEFDTPSMDDMPAQGNAEPDDFDLNLSDDLADNEPISTETLEPEADDAAGMDFSGGFDEVEGLGFGFDESPPAEEAPKAAAEDITMDAGPELEPEISLEPDLELPEEGSSIELPEEDDEQPSLELSEEPSLELLEDDLDLDTGEMDTFEEDLGLEDTGELGTAEEESSLGLPDDLELPEEPELMEPSMDETAEMEDDGGMEFDLDSVDLDEPEEISYEVPVEEAGDEEPSMDFDGLELEMETPEEPEDDDLTK